MTPSSASRFRLLLFLLTTFLFATGLPACSDYALQRSSPAKPSRGDIDEMPLREFRDCSQVLGHYYWYENHEFGVVLIYDGCLVANYDAYMVIEHEFWDMDGVPVLVDYETGNGDIVTADAWKYTLGFWYNPVDIEIQVVPHMTDVILGIHEFKLNCVDDDQMECDVQYMGRVDAQDFS